MTAPVASRIAVIRLLVYSYVRQAFGAPATVTDVSSEPVYAYVQVRSGRPSTATMLTWPLVVVIVHDQLPVSSAMAVGFPAPSYVMETARPDRRSCNRVR